MWNTVGAFCSLFSLGSLVSLSSLVFLFALLTRFTFLTLLARVSFRSSHSVLSHSSPSSFFLLFSLERMSRSPWPCGVGCRWCRARGPAGFGGLGALRSVGGQLRRPLVPFSPLPPPILQPSSGCLGPLGRVAWVQVVSRTGDPLVLEDWERCAVSVANSVVLVSPEHPSPQAADAQVHSTLTAAPSLNWCTPGPSHKPGTPLRSPTRTSPGTAPFVAAPPNVFPLHPPTSPPPAPPPYDLSPCTHPTSPALQPPHISCSIGVQVQGFPRLFALPPQLIQASVALTSLPEVSADIVTELRTPPTWHCCSPCSPLWAREQVSTNPEHLKDLKL